MGERKEAPRLSRRALLRAAMGATAAASGALLAACGGGASPTATSAPATTAAAVPTIAGTTAAKPTIAGTTAATAGTAPTTVASRVAGTTSASTPAVSGTRATGSAVARPATATVDGKIPATLPGVPDAYTKEPPVFNSVNAVPGRGGKVTAFYLQNGTPISPLEQNKYWQELNKRLGVTLAATLVPSGSYQEKLAAVTAAGDLADLTILVLGSAPDQNKAILQGAYADLTPYVTGDALKEYPNLAAYPPQLWKNIAIKGKIYGVPRPRYLVNSPLIFRQDWAEKVGSPHPQNADEFFTMATAFNEKDPDGNGNRDTYAFGAVTSNPFNLSFFENMFRVPNEWRRNSDGSLVRDIETDEFKGAVAYMRKLWAAGLFHPDTPMNLQKILPLFQASKIGGYSTGINGIPPLGPQVRALSAPTAEVIGLVAPGYDGGKAVWRMDSGTLGFVAVSAQAGKDKERVKELLRILNYFAAPFGSEEYHFINFGIEGVDYTLNAKGAPVDTDQGKAEISDLAKLTGPPPVFYYPDIPGEAQAMQQLVHDMLVIAIEDPTLTLYSPTEVQKAAELDQLQNDRLGAIVKGRDPLSALDTYIKDWRSRGGDQIRKEYQDALQGQ